LGEHKYGAAHAYSSVVALALGTGLGAGIIINGELYNGHNCGAGEIGYIPYLDRNFEFYSSGMIFEGHFNSTAFKMHEEAKKGNQLAIGQWEEYGVHLGNVIKAVMYTYDPEAILLGGSISQAYPFFEKSIFSALSDFQFPESLKKIRIFRSELENAALLGAAALAIPRK
jgi:glucokinase